MAGKTIVIAGSGNIGSFLVPLISRMTEVVRVILIDSDVYEQKNLLTQDIQPGDVGKPKAVVQARRMGRIRTDICVEPIVADIQSLPLGTFHGSVIISCLDNNAARQSLSEAAWRLGVPFIDAGVRGPDLLARVSVYQPGHKASCLECAWDEADYDLLEQAYPCDSASAQAPPTNSPAFLGALAASCQALEVAKVLGGHDGRAAAGKQILLDGGFHKFYASKLPYNSNCRFDHKIWHMDQLGWGPSELTVSKAFSLVETAGNHRARLSLAFPNKPFLCKDFHCPDCGRAKAFINLWQPGKAQETCTRCGTAMALKKFTMLPWVDSARLTDSRPDSKTDMPMACLGFRPGDVFALQSEAGRKYYEFCRGEDC